MAVGTMMLAGCAKETPKETAAPPAEVSAAPKPTAAAAVEPPTPSATATGATSATATATTTATPTAAGPKTFACGDKDKPPCPTQKWMKANMAPAVASEDTAALAKGLEYIAAHAPAGMPTWAGIAKNGAVKATAGDIAGAKAACKSCHDLYKAKYKAEVRDRAF